MRRRLRLHVDAFEPLLRIGAFRQLALIEMERRHLDARKRGGRQRQRGGAFDLVPGTDDPASGASDEYRPRHLRFHQRRDARRHVEVMRRGECDHQIGACAGETPAQFDRRLDDGFVGPFLARQGGCPPHALRDAMRITCTQRNQPPARRRCRAVGHTRVCGRASPRD